MLESLKDAEGTLAKTCSRFGTRTKDVLAQGQRTKDNMASLEEIRTSLEEIRRDVRESLNCSALDYNGSVEKQNLALQKIDAMLSSLSSASASGSASASALVPSPPSLEVAASAMEDTAGIPDHYYLNGVQIIEKREYDGRDEFWCLLCKKWWSEGHAQSREHTNRTQWIVDGETAESPESFYCKGVKIIEMRHYGDGIDKEFCILCGKWWSANHERSSMHTKRCQWPHYYMRLPDPADDQPMRLR